MKISLRGKGRSSTKLMVAAISLVCLSATGNSVLLPSPAQAAGSFADPAFQTLWARTDSLVASGQVKRSWLWGPQANSGALYEDYAEGASGKRLVQYLDKSRMEINNPNGDKNDRFYVTNGLLTVELITGYMQTGNNSRVLRWPAHIPLAGDTNVEIGPTYASFAGAITRKDETKSGQIVNAEVMDDGTLDFVHGGPDYANFDQYSVHYTYYEAVTGHNIPDIFWSFLNATGPVLSEGRQVTARLSDPYFYATGYPIADAYWAFSTVNGESTPVLIQPFQRRVLTYVPSAPEGFKVQVGNIGQHYYDWRYNDAGEPPVLTDSCENSPAAGFGKVYNDNLPVKLVLGCALASEFRVTITQQTFEHGLMLSVVHLDFYSNQYYDEVQALFVDNTAHSYHFYPVDMAAGASPPSGTIGSYSSTADFANVWSQNVEVGTKLGNPTANSSTVPAEADGTGGAPAQLFTGGLMLYRNLAGGQIYVLFNSSGNGYVSQGPHLKFSNIDHWAVYQDTYQP